MSDPAGMPRLSPRDRLRAAWVAAAGSEDARSSWPAWLREGELRVHCRTGALATSLREREPSLVRRLRTALHPQPIDAVTTLAWLPPTARTEPTDVAALADGLLAGLDRSLAPVLRAWRPAVGADLARVATPTRLRDGELQVRCYTAAWTMTVAHMQEEIVQALAGQLGPGVVHRIRARTGAPPAARERPKESSAPRTQVSDAGRQRAQEAVAALPEGPLRDSVQRAIEITAAQAGDVRSGRR